MHSFHNQGAQLFYHSMLYITCPELIPLITEVCTPWPKISSPTLTPASDHNQSTPFLWGQLFLDCTYWWDTTVFVSLCCFVLLYNVLKFYPHLCKWYIWTAGYFSFYEWILNFVKCFPYISWYDPMGCFFPLFLVCKYGGLHWIIFKYLTNLELPGYILCMFRNIHLRFWIWCALELHWKLFESMFSKNIYRLFSFLVWSLW